MKITPPEQDAECLRCHQNQVYLIQLLPWSAFYCLTCLRAAVSMLEGQGQKPTISTIQDGILAAIDNTSAGYLAAWHIADWLHVERTTIQGHKYPQNNYELALQELVRNGTLEEISDLSYRYRRIQK